MSKTFQKLYMMVHYKVNDFYIDLKSKVLSLREKNLPVKDKSVHCHLWLQYNLVKSEKLQKFRQWLLKILSDTSIVFF